MAKSRMAVPLCWAKIIPNGAKGVDPGTVTANGGR